MTSDNRGPPTPEDVARIRGEAARRMPGVRVHFGSLDDFARALVAENPDLPVVRGDMPDTWIHGWMSMPIEAKAVRTIRPLQPTLDVLDTQLRLWGRGTTNVAPALARAYELSNLYSEHTFGPCYPDAGSWNSHTPRNQYGAAWKTAHDRGAYKAYEGVFNDKRAYADEEADIVTRELSTRLDLLARSVAVAGRRTVVYNGLPWPRSGVVDVDGQSVWVEAVPASGYKTVDATPSSRQAQESGEGAASTVWRMNSFVDATPPSRQSKESGEGAVSTNTFDTPFYRVIFDLKRGGIASLVEKKTGRELVDQASPYVLGQFLHERFDRQRVIGFTKAYAKGYPDIFANTAMPSDVSYAALTPSEWTLVAHRGDVADVVTLTASNTLGLAKGIAIVITLNRHQPSVEIEWRVTDKTPDPIPEGGWLCFPFAVAQPQFTLGRLGGPIDPARDIVAGANRHLLCLNSGLTITGPDGEGIGLCPLDSPCVSLGEPGLNRFSLDYVAKKAALFVNLYNNVWRTNFPQWQDGSWTSRVRLWPVIGSAGDGVNLAVPAWEARLPLLAATVDAPAGPLPREQSGVSVSRKGVLVTAFGQNPDSAKFCRRDAPVAPAPRKRRGRRFYGMQDSPQPRVGRCRPPPC